METEGLHHSILRIYGVVQGVGFRPFIYRLATALGLRGMVLNKGAFVEVEIIGTSDEIATFISRMSEELPPLARIDSIERTESQYGSSIDMNTFRIIESQVLTTQGANIPPDIATCEACLKELFSDKDRRFNYPFLNCVDCGPRFTVIKNLPYDRSETSLACFPMCNDCGLEYENPADRRFHAEPTACPRCGPALWFEKGGNPELQQIQSRALKNDSSEDELTRVVLALRSGSIIAVKGLGGFQLICDATNDDTVKRLRERKGREAKPFALMVSDLEAAQDICDISPRESELLTCSARPIVLLNKKSNQDRISNQVAPTTNTLGVMLPYTPLHHLLLRKTKLPLVVTSGNVSEEPIAAGNREALARLKTIADGFLLNNRDIVSRYDDTVCSIVAEKPMVVRRARGFAPQAVQLPYRAKLPMLAVGGHLKNTFCLVHDDKAYLSQHIGDLESIESIQFFTETLKDYIRLFKIHPRLIALDMHPDYGSSRVVSNWLTRKETSPFSVDLIEKVIPVQHHFAHVVSCMAENHIDDTVIGVAFDGTGYGTDGNIWGGEFLLCTLAKFTRIAALKPVKMPGGTSSIREPWRMALGFLVHVENSAGRQRVLERLVERFGEKSVSDVTSVANSSISPTTTSCGRLFDAVACLLGICDINQYEGHAAVLLQREAELFRNSQELPASRRRGSEYSLTLKRREPGASTAPWQPQPFLDIDTTELISDVLRDLAEGKSTGEISTRFHDWTATMILEVCKEIRDRQNLNTVCLSGGVFQNRQLLEMSILQLRDAGFKVYWNSQVPINDGGLSLGQAVAALSQLAMLEPRG